MVDKLRLSQNVGFQHITQIYSTINITEEQKNPAYEICKNVYISTTFYRMYKLYKYNEQEPCSVRVEIVLDMYMKYIYSMRVCVYDHDIIKKTAPVRTARVISCYAKHSSQPVRRACMQISTLQNFLI